MDPVETSDEINEFPMSLGQTAQPVIPAYAWVILAVAYIPIVAAPLAMFKVASFMPLLIKTFNLNMVSAGALMSVFAITGLLLSVPASLVMYKLGLKVTDEI